MNKFKADIVVASTSKALLVQLYEEAKKLGWEEDKSYNSIFHPNAKPGVYVLKFRNDEISFHNHPCSGITHNLPADWDSVLKCISEKNPVKKSFNIGDWVIKENGKDNTPYKVESIDKDGWCIGDTPGNGWSSQILRLATEGEVKQHLIEKAKQLGFIDNLPLSRVLYNNNSNWAGMLDEWNYNLKSDHLHCHVVPIYDNGVWSTLLPDPDNTLEKLIKEAEEKYPKGTKFTPAHIVHPYCVYTSTGKVIRARSNKDALIIDIKEKEEWVPCVYYREKWADKPIIPTFKVGQRFIDKDDDVKYILAHCGDSNVILVNLNNGNLYTDKVKVNKLTQITEEEFSKICGGDNFELIK